MGLPVSINGYGMLVFTEHGRWPSAAAKGIIRLNGNRVRKASVTVRPGDIITLPRGGQVVAVQVEMLAVRRGPACDAQNLYHVLTETVLDHSAAGP